MRAGEHPEELIDRAARGTLGPEEQARLDQHLAGCPVCAAQLSLAPRFARELAPHPRDELLDLRAFEAMMVRTRNAPAQGLRRPAPAWLRWAAAAVLLVSGAAGAAALIVRRISAPPETPARVPAPAVEAPRPRAPTVPVQPPPAEAPAPPEPPTATVGPAAALSPHPAVTAPVLFERGEKLRREGRAGAAIATYRRLQAAFPDTPEAQLSFAFAGQLLLRQRRPDEALAQFDRHLKAGGQVGEEAMAGRATALEQLRRPGEAITAWKALLARYPGSVYTERARGRLDQLIERP